MVVSILVAVAAVYEVLMGYIGTIRRKAERVLLLVIYRPFAIASFAVTGATFNMAVTAANGPAFFRGLFLVDTHAIPGYSVLIVATVSISAWVFNALAVFAALL